MNKLILLLLYIIFFIGCGIEQKEQVKFEWNYYVYVKWDYVCFHEKGEAHHLGDSCRKLIVTDNINDTLMKCRIIDITPDLKCKIVISGGYYRWVSREQVHKGE